MMQRPCERCGQEFDTDNPEAVCPQCSAAAEAESSGGGFKAWVGRHTGAAGLLAGAGLAAVVLMLVAVAIHWGPSSFVGVWLKQLAEKRAAANMAKAEIADLRKDYNRLITEASGDTNNLKGSIYLKVLGEATARQPQNHALWQAQGMVLLRADRKAEAVAALDQCLGLTADTDKLRRDERVDLLLIRSRLSRELGQADKARSDYAEAGRINCQTCFIPERKAPAPPEWVDLSPYFNAELFGVLGWFRDEEGTQSVATEIERNTGVKHDLRGLVRLYGEISRTFGGESLKPIKGIAVGKPLTTLHILHATTDSVSESNKIGTYMVRYADGQTRELPIRYGLELRAVTDYRVISRGMVAWKPSTNGQSGARASAVQLCQLTWHNPRPEVAIASLDLVPTATLRSLFLVAITGATNTQAEAEVARAQELETGGDLLGALHLVQEACERWTNSAAIVAACGDYLAKCRRADEAVEAYARAIQVAERDAKSNALLLRKCHAGRGILLREMGQYDKAGPDICRSLGLPLRDSGTPREQLDLSPFYTANFVSDFLHGVQDAPTFETLRQTITTKTGVEFDLRGVIETRGTNGFPFAHQPRPSPTNEILAAAKFSRLYALMGTAWRTLEGIKIGNFTLHYQDHPSVELPITYGRHVRNWWYVCDTLPISSAVVAWRGEKADGNYRGPAQIYMASLVNPRPELEVKSIEFKGADTACAPFLLGLTVETPALASYWLNEAKALAGRGNLTQALAQLEEGIQKLPAEPKLWQAKGQYLWKQQRTNEALVTMTKALRLAEENPSLFENLKSDLLRNRAQYLREMGRLAEAAQANCQALEIPPRNPAAKPNQIDLAAFYFANMNRYLGTADAQAINQVNEAIAARSGVVFDMRGYIGLFGQAQIRDGHAPLPDSQRGIPINLAATRLHFLHTAGYADREGATIGHYIIHYSDGRQESCPIIYGANIRIEATDNRPLTQAEMVWSGSPELPERGRTSRFYKATWKVSRPGQVIRSLDFVSAKSESSPRLLAITVE